MKIAKLISALILGAVVMGVMMPSSVSANTTQNQNQNGSTVEQSQSADQEFEVECETGAYGQTSTCKVKGAQHLKQEQRVVIASAGGKLYHKPAATGLDLYTGMAALGTMITGAGAMVLRTKLNA